MKRTQEEALSRLFDVVLSHRVYRLCGRWLVLHVDNWFIMLEILGRWNLGIVRAGWRSRPFWGRTEQ